MKISTLEIAMHNLLNREAIDALLFEDEATLVHKLAKEAKLSKVDDAAVTELAGGFVQSVRGKRKSQGSIDAFMQEYSLSSEEGVVLMCLAEALLRIPDAQTADKLIADKIGGRDWESHLGQSESLFVNASAWGLMLTGRIVTLGQDVSGDAFGFMKRFVRRSGEPILRSAMKQAMRIMGKQFVLGQTIDEALANAEQGYRYSFDMLGESAMTKSDAAHYLASYQNALSVLARGKNSGEVFSNPSLSVKLSALHPRYEAKQAGEALPHLFQSLLGLARQAKVHNLGITLDAEEIARLDVSLELFGQLAAVQELMGWNGLGLAVQAYGKRAKPVLQWLAALARKTGRVLPVRLVKGAYWDTEIKRAQEAGLQNFPVFTRKVSTDVSYLACARYMLAQPDALYSQFATHNAQTVAAIMVMAAPSQHFEFQRLHGMGQALYDDIIGGSGHRYPCRVYAPVGSHKDLLAYLVRRLLENGANTSFVNRIADDAAPLAAIIANPVSEIEQLEVISNPRIQAPRELFAPRLNSAGIAMWRDSERHALIAGLEQEFAKKCDASALVNGQRFDDGPKRLVSSPQDHNIEVGVIHEASAAAVALAMESAQRYQPKWDGLGGRARATILEKAAALYEKNKHILMALLVREAGKTLDNALGDLREAVDFLRYYAAQARLDFSKAVKLPGPTGESNELTLHGRGVIACISPWNFPLAIFTGQVSAALAAGNAVAAKPAEQTPLVAWAAVKILHEAGVPPEVLQFLPGDGARIGATLLNHPALAGVAFTGSNETARLINRTLANRDGAIPVFIAETGGMNAMIIDSSALPEQAVRDVVASAFDSAGQRCSAARILFVQSDIAPRVMEMLQGAMAELKIGDPMNYSTDIGPVIDEEARLHLQNHKDAMAKSGRVVFDIEIPEACTKGTYVSPAAYELPTLDMLSREVFGPVLHVIQFEGSKLDAVCDQINAKGFGLTLGLHTRIESVVRQVRARMRVGNLYVNRNQIGAVVGAQPFGGEGLSGTGPKAGGPHTLHRLAVERVCSVDTTASGGNAELLALI
jgi:RHH-type transcriptional regulator, proline utilization regulon repressor / proline dehydrogenase / delta 1-pyrroline-5-carboxylate dehydrogenase